MDRRRQHGSIRRRLGYGVDLPRVGDVAHPEAGRAERHAHPEEPEVSMGQGRERGDSLGDGRLLLWTGGDARPQPVPDAWQRRNAGITVSSAERVRAATVVPGTEPFAAPPVDPTLDHQQLCHGADPAPRSRRPLACWTFPLRRAALTRARGTRYPGRLSSRASFQLGGRLIFLLVG